MRAIFACIPLLLSVTMAKSQTDSITISGQLKGLNNNKIGISYVDENGKTQYTSLQSINDKFSGKVKAQTIPAGARLSVAWPRDPSAKPQMPMAPFNFFVWNKNLSITGDANSVPTMRIKGDEENNLYDQLKQQSAKSEVRYQELLNMLGKKLSAKDSLALHQEIRETSQAVYVRQKELVKTHPNNFTSVFLLSRMTNLYSADNYVAAWNALAPTYKNTEAGKSIQKTVEKLAPTLAGTAVFAFERTDKDGNKVSPALLKGKTYLLDFWGSWCGPCRASHPHLKELYKKYKGKGFEIVAVAQERGKTLDDSKASWLKAIQDDQITWVHILNQDGIEKQDIVKTYHVNAFPTKILVDAEGKIILRVTASATDDIDKALEKIYGF
ncbi:AhpC/TSA family protein [Pedobacter frigoris]|uniref:AhpC/TSA family protein n=1 Tax=Pedobacter frigoris TaxID=2571272 RepID=A0A4U1CPS4_9SPHI|nr:AhpC/TSA family protein [Pedobacter frigoris]TKC07434.1 AhpC/TSA family protein [Pedobacter frigoris]